ncbi:4-hydroxyphenylpyruvate dioxygenase [Streptomyces agglomeratus]|uniref:4-hydroxyphenylpyruvate dioxygenase n=1 Tax=Streptomyces agglomeratus TaxID=285458 RepID=A0A1E5PIF4_9ACTN|nr:4-hydroxyphenylpyruvate dioxygenase [Streptomyces agglomeratus]OEJ29282.1 4-hydroxyphenylpyruvate dioxygenase [Streptomyces agglomeratus]OEJ42708.1 4-hydroxyphenylpyruvate dioxygenase [Streptomyces agglomeratus]OEJ48779.1 4-hydroxyphenylpyruvate dioxygenase [Streptomyces agglomeratus]OEJ56020.1 4-hydroxyphenylpyruvate dioxygenase [Streptomyces agglomeratus]OEJ63410.1 4-hydroxyphenylpyruvate dioxygenase [Streptomyces agglomeratus]
MTVHGVDHVEFYVGDAVQAAHYYRTAYGFQVVAEAPAGADGPAARSFVLAHGGVRLVLTSALSDEHAAAAFVRTHGDGVRDVALRTDDAVAAFDRAVGAGAEAVAEPRTYEDETGRVVRATVAATNGLVHSFVQRDNPDGNFLPGSHLPVVAGAGPAPDLLDTIDHLAFCLSPGSLDEMVNFYEKAIGLRHTYDEYIEVGGQAMASRVVQDETRGITFTMVEPDPSGGRGQLHDFLDGFGGAGVQHVAYSTKDIVRAARELRSTGVELLSSPAAYYSSLAHRGIDVGIDAAVLQEHGLLVDRDEWGQLVQVFTRSPYARRTVFFELIQRFEARTFGSGNIKALYEAVDRERANAASGETPSGAGR